MIFIFIVFFLASLALGAIPLTDLSVKLLTGVDLKAVGTGNVSVSAAFTHGGRLAGIVAVCGEIGRGIAPVIIAQILLPDYPPGQLFGLIALVLGRYCFAQGGGITNVTWGLFVYSPWVTLSIAITGVTLWQLAVRLCPQYPDQARRWGGSLGCLTGAGWIWFWHQWPQPLPLSGLEVLAGGILSILIVAINLRQADDLALVRTQSLVSLKQRLQGQIHGNKATRLAELQQAGFPVPVGWVIPATLSSPTPDQTSVTPTLNISRLIRSLTPHFPLIVRSSAIGEDSDSNSAAGQYLTIGPVNKPLELQDAIDRCIQSYWQPPAIAYRQHRNLTHTGIAILIQPYLTGEVSGVLFTRHPLDGGSQMIIEALPGNAETVVTGQVTPLHLEIDISPDHGSLEQQLNPGESSRPSWLTLDLITQLVEQGKALEAFFHGIPQDIEWTWDGKTLWILQSRPITNLRPIWTRTIAAEVIPGAIHPLTWSINRPLTCGVWGNIFTLVLGEKAQSLDFTETATLLGSHAYFNATLLGEIFRMMGLPEQGLEFLIRGQKMGKPPIKNILPSLPGLWRLIQKEFSLVQDFERDETDIFRPALQQLAQVEYQHFAPEPNPDLISPQTLLRQIENILEWLKPITYYNILGPIGLAIRRSIFQVPESWLPTETYPEIRSIQDLQTLATKLTPSHSDPEISQSFADDPTLQQEFNSWLSEYGYLSEVGTDISVLTWREEPEKFQTLLWTLHQKNDLSTQKTLKSSPQTSWERWRFSQCQKQSLIKGKIAEIYSRFLAHLRWHFLELETYGLNAQILDQPGDIFYLHLSEIQAWINQGETTELKPNIHRRREALARDRQRSVPMIVYGNLLPEITTEPQVMANTAILQGIPASAGTVEGVIKICHSTATIISEPDAILVVPYTDAGWIPLLLQAKAIIAEVGGQLSHGAIIAREYGIPAIMNLTHATTLLQEGERVRVNGYRGTVERVPE